MAADPLGVRASDWAHTTNPGHLVPSTPSPTDVPPLRVADHTSHAARTFLHTRDGFCQSRPAIPVDHRCISTHSSAILRLRTADLRNRCRAKPTQSRTSPDPNH